MELYIFGRFLVLDGKESAFEAALGDVVTLRLRSGQASTRVEEGCLAKGSQQLTVTVDS